MNEKCEKCGAEIEARVLDITPDAPDVHHYIAGTDIPHPEPDCTVCFRRQLAQALDALQELWQAVIDDCEAFPPNLFTKMEAARAVLDAQSPLTPPTAPPPEPARGRQAPRSR